MRCLSVILVALCLVAPRSLLGQEANPAETKPAATETKPVKASVAAFTLKGSFPESGGPAGLFAEIELDLPAFLERLEKAANDKDIAAVLLKFREPAFGLAKGAEIRAAIRRVRAAGKKVYAEMQSASAPDYLVACACDEIVMPESGSVMIPGLRAEITFYKGLFDKLGVEADMLQVGRFKGAAEPYSRTGMSAEFRAQYELVLDDMYNQLIATIAADRRLAPEKVKEIVDTGLLSAREAKAQGLIDTVAYGDELEAALKTKLDAGELALVEDYGKKKVDADFSGMLGMVKLFELMAGVEPEKKTSRNKKIAVVYAVGVIMPDAAGGLGMLSEQVASAEAIVKAMREAAADKTVAAIVLRVDSPGGSALASDLIWREIVRSEKPVVCSMGETAASGGYYIAMGCDRILAEAGTLTGSIGVVGGKISLKGLYDLVGLKTEIISRGKNSGLFSTEGKFSDSERQVWQRSMEETYRLFVGKAATGRKLTPAKLEGLAEGRIWTGRQAQAHGLVDDIGTLDDAIASAKKLAGLTPDEKIERLILPRPQGLFEALFGGDVRAPLPRSGLAGDLAQKASAAASLQRLFAEPSVLMLPYRVKVK